MCVILFCCLLSGVARANPTVRPRKRREVIGFVRKTPENRQATACQRNPTFLRDQTRSLDHPPLPSEKKKKKKIDVLSLSRIVGPINYLRCDNGQIVLVTFSRESEWLFFAFASTSRKVLISGAVEASQSVSRPGQKICSEVDFFFGWPQMDDETMWFRLGWG